MKRITKKQIEVLKALMQPGAVMMPPYDMMGRRYGYVTRNGSVSGWICGVALSTKKILEQEGLIAEDNGLFKITEAGKMFLKLSQP